MYVVMEHVAYESGARLVGVYETPDEAGKAALAHLFSKFLEYGPEATEDAFCLIYTNDEPQGGHKIALPNFQRLAAAWRNGSRFELGKELRADDESSDYEFSQEEEAWAAGYLYAKRLRG